MPRKLTNIYQLIADGLASGRELSPLTKATLLSLGYRPEDLIKPDDQTIRQMARSTDKEVIGLYQKHFDQRRNERIEKAKEEYVKQRELFGSSKENQMRENMEKEDLQKLIKIEQ